ncbi:MAG: hypothetical protein Q4D71_03750 [Oscillospiraceae bacterium]|nr:hypothetical protein [Oscillospiraceae bacterium]
MANKKTDKKISFIDTVIKNPLIFLAAIGIIAVLILGIVTMIVPRNHTNPNRADYPKVRTTQVGSYVFDVPGEWQIGGDFSYYKDFFLDSSDRVNYSRVCYKLLYPVEPTSISDYAEQFWTETSSFWNITVTKVEYEPITICGSDAIEITYSGTVPGRNTNGTFILMNDTKDDAVLCLSYERVGAASSANSNFKKVKNSLREYDGKEEITHDIWYDLNADTLQDFHFDYALLEFDSNDFSGITNSWNVYLYDTSNQLIFFFTETREEPHHVESQWTPENLIIYRYVGDLETGAFAYMKETDYPDTLAATRDWFIKEKAHWAKGKLLYDVHVKLDVDETIEKFQNEFGAY